MTTILEPRARKILSIDGCGFRGRTQLFTLQRIMRDMAAPGQTLKPCDVFDLICGTAAGGLIAILLGRLKMSCDEAIDAYNDLEQKLFGNVNNISAMTGGFDTTNFRNALTALVNRRSPTTTNFLESPDPQCKTFITVMQASSSDDIDPYIIRSYRKTLNPHRPRLGDPEAIPGHNWQIWQAAIGSISCPRLFNPLNLDHGPNPPDLPSPLLQAANASGFSNPSVIAYIEALDLWGTNAVLTLVSLGMGIRTRDDPRDSRGSANLPNDPTLDDVLLALGVDVARSASNERLRDFIRQTKRVATATQVKHIRLNERTRTSGPHQKYYRFDPTGEARGLVLIDYGANLRPAIELAATNFMNLPGTRPQLKEVTEKLKINHGLVVRIGNRCGGTGGVSFNGRHSTMGARLKQINVWTKPWISSIELVYEFQGREFSTGRYGGFGGTRNTLNLNAGEYVHRVAGQASSVILQLSFHTRTHAQVNSSPRTFGTSSSTSLLNPTNWLGVVANLSSSLQGLLSGSQRSFDININRDDPLVGLGWFEGTSGELVDSLTPCFIRQDCVVHT